MNCSLDTEVQHYAAPLGKDFNIPAFKQTSNICFELCTEEKEPSVHTGTQE